MKIESLKLTNFKAFRNAKMENIPKFCVIVGANGTGKSTLFNLFGFLKDALNSDVHTALLRLGGNRGFQEVRSRGATENISIELKFRNTPDGILKKKQEVQGKTPLITYFLEIGEENGHAYVEQEYLQYRRGSRGKPWRFLDFRRGEGSAVINELDDTTDIRNLKRENQKLRSPDILAIKGLANYERFPAVVSLATLIENWHVSDFHISRARPEQEVGFANHLSREGENLSLVIQFLYDRHRDLFNKIMTRLQQSIPGITSVEAKTTEEGRVLLKFHDGAFKDPFLARYVSDGTIKMLAYLTLLYDPTPHPLLCVEEPENQLYPSLLYPLAEEFRAYTNSENSQVWVSTHSPDFLNATELDEVFWLEKKDGYTQIVRACDNQQIRTYMENGDQMGYLWKEGLFGKADPK